MPNSGTSTKNENQLESLEQTWEQELKEQDQSLDTLCRTRPPPSHAIRASLLIDALAPFDAKRKPV